MTDTNAAALLAAYEAEVRLAVPDPAPPGEFFEWDGPVLRQSGERHRFVVSRDLGDFAADQLDALIARQISHYAARHEEFEWKTWSHVGPFDLGAHLVAAGFRAGPPETVLIGSAVPIAREPRLPDGIRLRLGSADDLAGVAELYASVWPEEATSMVEFLARRLVADPAGLDLVLAEKEGRVVGTGRVNYEFDSSFASLWGGAIHPAWQHRGVYRAGVAWRAHLALEHERSLLQVDAAETSRPILERLGFVVVASTTPYVWEPPADDR